MLQLLESLDFSTREPGLHEETKIPSLPTAKSSNKTLTKTTPRPDGKGKLGLMFKFQDIFTPLILDCDF